MQYFGKLYGKIGKKYIQLDKTAEEVDAELKSNSNRINVSADTLFEVKQIHGIEAVYHIIDALIDEHAKTMKFPHPVSANNGEDVVYIHEDGTRTWNTEKKDNQAGNVLY